MPRGEKSVRALVDLEVVLLEHAEQERGRLLLVSGVQVLEAAHQILGDGAGDVVSGADGVVHAGVAPLVGGVGTDCVLSGGVADDGRLRLQGLGRVETGASDDSALGKGGGLLGVVLERVGADRDARHLGLKGIEVALQGIDARGHGRLKGAHAIGHAVDLRLHLLQQHQLGGALRHP